MPLEKAGRLNGSVDAWLLAQDQPITDIFFCVISEELSAFSFGLGEIYFLVLYLTPIYIWYIFHSLITSEFFYYCCIHSEGI